MAVTMEAKGKTVDEAVLNGLAKMNLSIDEVEIEVLEDNKGIFGIGKSARVRLTQKEGLKDQAEQFLNGLFKKMGVAASASAQEEETCVKIEIEGKATGSLIGRRGETLDAIQYLTSLVVNKEKDEYKKITVDCENYRRKREETLEALAHRLAEKTKRYGRRTVLEPMNPYERRIFHSALQSDPQVRTYSEGEEPYRHVVIDLKK